MTAETPRGRQTLGNVSGEVSIHKCAPESQLLSTRPHEVSRKTRAGVHSALRPAPPHPVCRLGLPDLLPHGISCHKPAPSPPPSPIPGRQTCHPSSDLPRCILPRTLLSEVGAFTPLPSCLWPRSMLQPHFGRGWARWGADGVRSKGERKYNTEEERDKNKTPEEQQEEGREEDGEKMLWPWKDEGEMGYKEG